MRWDDVGLRIIENNLSFEYLRLIFYPSHWNFYNDSYHIHGHRCVRPTLYLLHPSAAVDCLSSPADNSKEVLICHEKGWWFGVHNNRRSICSCLRAPQLRIRPRPCPISGVRAKIIIILKILAIRFYLTLNSFGHS